MRHKNNAIQVKEIARQRIQRLFELAAMEQDTHPERSNRYVQIARRIGTRIRIRMPRQTKREFCKHCGCYLFASSLRVRLSKGVVTSTCLKCSRQKRFPYKN